MKKQYIYPLTETYNVNLETLMTGSTQRESDGPIPGQIPDDGNEPSDDDTFSKGFNLWDE